MVDVDTFLTILYVTVEDFCHSHPPKKRPGPQASLSESEIITLAIFARWSRFNSERDFYRYAEARLLSAFPTLPTRPQFNRLVRSCTGLIEQIVLHLATLLGARECPYEALDSSAMPTRDCKRRGAGWLAGYADVSWSNSIGWYEGFSLLTAVDPSGVVTGFCFGSASTADQRLAETFFAVRAVPHTQDSSARERSAQDLTSPTRVSKAPRTTGGGLKTTERASSIRPNATPERGFGPNA
jgi:hypothetical protein